MSKGTEVLLEMEYICPHCGGEMLIKGVRPAGLPFKIIQYLQEQPEAVRLRDIAAYFRDYNYGHVQSAIRELYGYGQISRPAYGYYTTGKSK